MGECFSDDPANAGPVNLVHGIVDGGINLLGNGLPLQPLNEPEDQTGQGDNRRLDGGQDAGDGAVPVNAVEEGGDLRPDAHPRDGADGVVHLVKEAIDDVACRLRQKRHVQAQDEPGQGLQANFEPGPQQPPELVPVNFRNKAVDECRETAAQVDPVKTVQERGQEVQRQIQPRAQGLPQELPFDSVHQAVQRICQVLSQFLHLVQHTREGEHIIDLLGPAVEAVSKAPERGLQLGDALQEVVQERVEYLAPGGEGRLLITVVEDSPSIRGTAASAAPALVLRLDLVDLIESGQGPGGFLCGLAGGLQGFGLSIERLGVGLGLFRCGAEEAREKLRQDRDRVGERVDQRGQRRDHHVIDGLECGQQHSLEAAQRRGELLIDHQVGPDLLPQQGQALVDHGEHQGALDGAAQLLHCAAQRLCHAGEDVEPLCQPDDILGDTGDCLCERAG